MKHAPLRPDTRDREKIIEMITSLYVLVLRSGPQIDPYEVNILYTLLENLFKSDDISWEAKIRHINELDQSLDEVLSFLNKNLITLDKIRILLSLIVLANSDDEFSASEVTKILELSKKMNLETEGFMAVIDAIEYAKSEPVSIKGFRYFCHAERSIFRDYVVAGRAADCDLRFRDRRIQEHELLLMVVDRFVFIGAGRETGAKIGEFELLPNRLYTFPENGSLTVGALTFEIDHLRKIHHARQVHDTIGFKSLDYKFHIVNNANRYSILVQQSSVYRNGRLLPHGKEQFVYYDDMLQIKGYEPFSLLDVIRRRAEIGVSNLRPRNLYITAGNDYFRLAPQESAQTVASIEFRDDAYELQPPRQGWEIQLNGQPVTAPTPLALNTDIITLAGRNYRLNSFLDLIEAPFEVDQLQVVDIKHYFRDGVLALDGISFEVGKGEMLAIMGQSGCGKSTLLKSIAGELIPTYGTVMIDNKSFYSNLSHFTQYIGHVPQEDLLFGSLTVYENLLYRGRLQLSSISLGHLRQKIDNILTQINLSQRRDLVVGDEKGSRLSGGERKRLNIALELLFEPTIIICDEPTSGLSSTDSEQIVRMLKTLSRQGKIVITTIHQPSPDIFEQFDRVLLMDRGGKQVFFGETSKTFDYFSSEAAEMSVRAEAIIRKRDLRMPEFMYEVVEYPEYDAQGDPVYIQMEENVVAKRRFPPVYWRDKFKRKMLFDLMQVPQRSEPNLSATRVRRRKMSLAAHAMQLLTFIRRNLLMKLRNRTNMFITFAEAPLLAFLVAFILRLAPTDGPYTFNENVNLGVYLFISVIVFIFLGLSNSIEEILAERRTILREKMLNLKMTYYLLSKLLSLGVFAAVQVLLYVLASSLILEIRGMFVITVAYLFASAAIGFTLGLLISCFIHNTKAIINILPLMLIPQIIFGGAVIQYERMNRDLTFIKGNPIPEIVQVIPARWLFEGMYTAYGQYTKPARVRIVLDKKRDELQRLHVQGLIGTQERNAMRNDLREQQDRMLASYPRDDFVNETIYTVVGIMDGRSLNRGGNVFLSSGKRLWGGEWVTWEFNLTVIAFYLMLMITATYIKLKFFYRE
ncbi:MAG: ATP-binding cassette domain-containing protein [Candidatus Cloacimonetes bacterium]|nr:ATP-binding cassette domain-containing protein [Candidatus Cloacimonadota bacterium]